MKLVVIGSGPAGHTVALEASQMGWNVTLIENCKLGGTCLNAGCIPTKTLKSSADALDLARRMPEFAVSACDKLHINPVGLQQRKNRVIDILRDGLAKTCVKLGVNLVYGQAKLKSPKEISAETKAGLEEFTADRILLATGSTVLNLPGLPFDHQYILDSSDALDLEVIPKSIIIVGGGVIGCELACIYKSFGSEVTIVEAQERLLPLPSIDADISSFLAREMRKRKIKMHLGKSLENVEIKDNMCSARLAVSPFADKSQAAVNTELMAEKIFVTVGRKADLAWLGLENCGIMVDQKGWIMVNDYYQTACENIYAAGDVLGPTHMMLAHVASMEGLCALKNMKGEKSTFDYGLVPSAIFTDPEIGLAGLTEIQAREKFPDIICATRQMRELGKAQAMGELPGFCKIVANASDGRILGVFICGAHASDLIAEAVIAMSRQLTVYDLANLVHAHPTLSELLWETARDAVHLMARKK